MRATYHRIAANKGEKIPGIQDENQLGVSCRFYLEMHHKQIPRKSFGSSPPKKKLLTTPQLDPKSTAGVKKAHRFRPGTGKQYYLLRFQWLCGRFENTRGLPTTSSGSIRSSSSFERLHRVSQFMTTIPSDGLQEPWNVSKRLQKPI